MTFLKNLKQAFGLGTPTAKAPPTPVPVNSKPTPTQSGLPSTPRQRELLYGFIIEKLGAYSSETEGLPTGLTLWIRCADKAEEDRMSVALYANQPGHFQQELSRHLADHYIRFAPDWRFSWHFVRDELPAECTYQQGNLGLEVIRPATEKPLRARVRVLTGQTAEESYLLDPAIQTDFRIGRGQMVQTASGRVRTNDIAFLDGGEPDFDPERGEPNLSVSRQHATIRYDAATRQYRLLADAGGLPANGNKTKILRANDTIERADLPGVGYVVSPGDQIELGGEAKLLFELA
jgi:hypothetical protein